MPLKPCLDCGELHAGPGPRCPRHADARRREANQARAATSPYRSPEHRRFARAVIARDGACVLCGTTAGLNAHHVVRLEDGGSFHPSNGVALCDPEHRAVEAALRRGDTTAAIVQRVDLVAAQIRARYR